MFIYLLVLLFISTGTFDYGDGLTHYFISRYSWKYPHLMLDDWGKPLFTILSSPFSQFGLKGITLFNIFCGLAAGWLAYKIASRFSIPMAPLAIIFTCSAPIYLSVMNSGLTEPLFSLMLIWCIWLLMNEHYYSGALVFSFLPFVRPEFIFVLPVFVLYFIIKKKYLAPLLMPTGTIIFSIAGWFYYKNLLWLIKQNPYAAGNTKNYADAGKGALLGYVRDYHNITGTAMAALLLFGGIWFVVMLYFNFKKKTETGEKSHLYEEVILVYGSAFLIFLCHSLVWGLGIFPTLGLARYMSTIIPLASILALRGVQAVFAILPRKINRISYPVLIIIVALVIYSPYKLWYKVPFAPDKTGYVITEATTWLKNSEYASHKVYYQDPYITVKLNIDPYDFTTRGELWSMNSTHPEENMKPGDILIWDAHFGAEEGQMNIDTLMNDTRLKLLRTFKPATPFKVIGNRDYAVYIFICTSAEVKVSLSGNYFLCPSTSKSQPSPKEKLTSLRSNRATSSRCLPAV